MDKSTSAWSFAFKTDSPQDGSPGGRPRKPCARRARRIIAETSFRGEKAAKKGVRPSNFLAAREDFPHKFETAC
jgi:hypothetical protein